MITQKESNAIYYAKAFAIFSVVCAHISVVPDTFSERNIFLCTILNEIGAIGVGLFFIISGFLFKRTEQNHKKFSDFWINKTKKIIIPWILSAFFVYMYVAIRKGGSISEMACSIIGYGSSYWYMTVLCICYIIFYVISKSRKDRWLCILMIVISFISVILRYVGIIKQDSLGVYLNTFNWTVFFSIGYLCANKKNYEKIFNRKLLFIFLPLAVALLVVPLMCFNEKFSYYSYFYIPVELIICYIIFSISYSLSNYSIKGLVYLGKIAFTLFLYNEFLWAGLVTNLSNRIDSAFLILARPFVVIIAVVIEMKLGKLVFKFLNKEKLFCSLVGGNV